jgi:DNA ligase 1
MSVLQQLDLIKAATGAHKLSILKEFITGDEVFAKVIKYAYTPSFKYNIALSQLVAPKGEEKLPIQAIFLTLDDVLNRRATGRHAINLISALLRALSWDDVIVVQRILKKDLRCGIALDTIKKAVGANFIPYHKVMKAYNLDLDTLQFPVWVSFKLDFLRATYKHGQLLSTKGNAFKGVDHILEQLVGAPELDGELTIPGMEFNQASGLLRSNKDCPTAVFNTFDVADSPLWILKDRLLICQAWNKPNVKLIKHKLVHSKEAVIEYFNLARSLGHEGIVVKTPKHLYVTKRSRDWMKLKPSITVDGQIVRINEGQGRLAGTMGSVTVRHTGLQYVGTYYTNVGAFPDHIRDEIWNNKAKYMDAWIEFDGMEFTPDNSVRHPAFCRFREDL